jgi:cytochrome b subunit of formate dehydrogenase
MAESDRTESTRRLHRTIVLCAVFVGIAGLGMLLAGPLAALFRSASPWVLPLLAVGVLVALVIITLWALPRFRS